MSDKRQRDTGINWSTLDQETDSMKAFFPSAAPSYSSLCRLKKEVCKAICDDPYAKDLLKRNNVFTEDLSARVLSKRTDHLTLKTLLMCYDFIYNDSSEIKLRGHFLSLFTSQEMLDLNIGSKERAEEYIKETIPVDVVLSMYENMLIFKHGKNMKEVSKIIARESASCFNGRLGI